MRKAWIAQSLLELTAPPQRAETMAGDLVEEARARGALWFAAALGGVWLAMFFHAVGSARARMLGVLGVGLAMWLALYAAARIAAAALGVQPLVIDTHDVAALPLGTVAYLGTMLALSNFFTGVLMSRTTRPVQGMSAVMPLAMFWASAALIGFCADLAAGRSSAQCVLVYLGGVPLLYIAPLLLGGRLGRPLRERPFGPSL